MSGKTILRLQKKEKWKMDTENACRVLTANYGDLTEGLVGALLPEEENSEDSFVDVEFPVNGKIVIDTIPVCILRQASSDEFKSFQMTMWDIYDKTNWN